MALNSAIPVSFELAFPHGAFLTGGVSPINTFENGKAGAQQRHPETGELMWQITVMDGDPDIQGPAKLVKVKIAASHQPVPPSPLPGLPITPIELDGLTGRPYIVMPPEGQKSRPRIVWSLTARDILPVDQAGA